MAKGFKHGAGGGTSLNFKVVGGTTQPTNPKENTIWVNTDTKITGWVFSATQPTEPTEGMVWVYSGTVSTVEFNALKNNAIQVYPIKAKQYIGDAWGEKETKTYRGEAWVNWWNCELYDSGDECFDYTGGWESVELKYTSSGEGRALRVTNIDGGVKLQGNINRGGIYKTKNKVKLSGYKTVFFTGSIKRDPVYGNESGLAIMPELGSTIKEKSEVYFVSAKGVTDYDDKAIANIEGLEGEYYLAFYINSDDDQYINLKRLRIE
jgi:hypothetical protein